jgi:WD40 repeat protein
LHRDNGGAEGDPTLYSALSAISNDPLILRGHQDAVRAIVTSADGKWLFSCGDDQKVIRWNLESPEKQPVFAILPKEIKENFRSIILTHDEKWVVAGTTQGKIIVWNNSLFPSSVIVINAHESSVNSLVASPVSNGFYSAGSDGKVLKWLFDGKNFESVLLDKVSEPILCSHVNYNETEIVYTVASGVVRTLNLTKEPVSPQLLTTLKSQALSVRYKSGSNDLVFGCHDGSIQLVQTLNNKEVIQTSYIGRHISGINALTFSSDGLIFGSASYDWSIRLSSFPLGEEKPISIVNHELWIYDLLFTPDGNHLISCSADKTIRIFSVRNEQMAQKVKPKIHRNLTKAEWSKLVGEDIPYQKTIAELP